jgi:hypothetical protein
MESPGYDEKTTPCEVFRAVGKSSGRAEARPYERGLFERKSGRFQGIEDGMGLSSHLTC